MGLHSFLLFGSIIPLSVSSTCSPSHFQSWFFFKQQYSVVFLCFSFVSLQYVGDRGSPRLTVILTPSNNFTITSLFSVCVKPVSFANYSTPPRACSPHFSAFPSCPFRMSAIMIYGITILDIVFGSLSYFSWWRIMRNVIDNETSYYFRFRSETSTISKSTFFLYNFKFKFM